MSEPQPMPSFVIDGGHDPDCGLRGFVITFNHGGFIAGHPSSP